MGGIAQMGPSKHMTEQEWLDLGESLFGTDKMKWRFRCPKCAIVVSGERIRSEFSEEQRTRLRENDYRPEQECIGRHLPGIGCNWAAYGLFSGPWFVERESGIKTPVFPFDDLDTKVGASTERVQ